MIQEWFHRFVCCQLSTDGVFFPLLLVDTLPLTDDESGETDLEEAEMDLEDFQRLMRELPEYAESVKSADDFNSKEHQ